MRRVREQSPRNRAYGVTDATYSARIKFTRPRARRMCAVPAIVHCGSSCAHIPASPRRGTVVMWHYFIICCYYHKKIVGNPPSRLPSRLRRKKGHLPRARHGSAVVRGCAAQGGGVVLQRDVARDLKKIRQVDPSGGDGAHMRKRTHSALVRGQWIDPHNTLVARVEVARGVASSRNEVDRERSSIATRMVDRVEVVDRAEVDGAGRCWATSQPY